MCVCVCACACVGEGWVCVCVCVCVCGGGGTPSSSFSSVQFSPCGVKQVRQVRHKVLQQQTGLLEVLEHLGDVLLDALQNPHRKILNTLFRTAPHRKILNRTVQSNVFNILRYLL